MHMLDLLHATIQPYIHTRHGGGLVAGNRNKWKTKHD